MPDRALLTSLSLRILEDAYAENRISGIERTVAHRMALGWLVYSGVCDEANARSFWRKLARRSPERFAMVQGVQVPNDEMRILDWCYFKAGLARPVNAGRERWLVQASERLMKRVASGGQNGDA